jgi:hypothetical protein
MARRLPSKKVPAKPASTDDYLVSIASKSVQKGRYYGTLSLVRKTDGRTLYPFDGAPDLGPFPTFVEARAAAQSWASKLISADLSNPEK